MGCLNLGRLAFIVQLDLLLRLKPYFKGFASRLSKSFGLSPSNDEGFEHELRRVAKLEVRLVECVYKVELGK